MSQPISSSHAIALPHHQAALLDAPTVPQVSDRLFTRTFTWGFIASFGLRTNLYLISVIMTTYCMSRYGCDISCVSIATGIFTIGCLAARFCGSRLPRSDPCQPPHPSRERRRPTLLIVPGFIALGAGIFLMGLSTNDIELLAAAALIGYGLGAIQPTGLALSTQYLGRSRYTVANATFYMMTDLACGISPITFGFVVPVLGYPGLFCSLLALSAAGIAGYIVLHRAHRV